jgi:hypothetical protein
MPTQEQKRASDLGEQAIALAEQLGRIAGTIQGTTEAWLNNPSLATQLTKVRDGAAEMLKNLSTNATGRRASGKGKKKTGRRPSAAARTASPAHAPGKRRRGPAPSARGVKKSEQAIPKLRTAHAVRQRRKSYA